MSAALRRPVRLFAFGLSLVLLAHTAALVAAEAKKEGFAQVRAQPLVDNPAAGWPEMQFVQADKQGRVVVLRGDTLELFALTPSGRFVARGKLEDGGPRSENDWIEAAALSPAGDVWVTLMGLNRLEIFRGGKSTLRLESPWMVSSVAADDGPVLGVIPAELNTSSPESLRLAAPPLIKRWDGKAWETLVEGEVPPSRKTSGASPMEWFRGQFGTLIALAPNGQLWLADRNAFRLRHFTASGLLKDELRAGKGEVVWAKRTGEDFARLEKSGAAVGFSFDPKKVSPVAAKPTYRAMAVGRDGLVYLLAETSAGLALDRFDPAYPAYERVLLSGVTFGTGPVALVAGAHSLFLAPRMAKDGLWEIPEDELQNADWREVPEATVNGTPIPPRQPEPAPVQGGPEAPS